MSVTELYAHRNKLMREMNAIKTPKSDVSMSEFSKWIIDTRAVMDAIASVNSKIKRLKIRGYTA